VLHCMMLNFNEEQDAGATAGSASGCMNHIRAAGPQKACIGGKYYASMATNVFASVLQPALPACHCATQHTA
jgi:hypothetical protein